MTTATGRSRNALDAAGRIDTPVLLLAGYDNGLWLDSQKLCHEVLAQRQPQLDVAYTEIPGYGHPDTFLGRGAALDVFGHISTSSASGGDGRLPGRPEAAPGRTRTTPQEVTTHAAARSRRRSTEV
ncbi:hypothetical protein AB0D12_36565 [Streptomyces sp. NPDC048479]|uniref:hypothetical protein n=1 Tax=Streptomyces sp. NPDC048479 TaxID=3154725 RepID=UPI00343A91FC